MKKAIIYVRGNNEETQEKICKDYASEKGYKVLFVTTDLSDVNNCDVLLVAKQSRISRDKMKYYQTLKDLKSRGIELVSVSSQNNSIETLDFARLLKNYL